MVSFSLRRGCSETCLRRHSPTTTPRLGVGDGRETDVSVGFRPLREVFTDVTINEFVKETAILHIAFAVLVGAGILVSDSALRLGLFALGGICFVAGIVLARRSDDDEDQATAGDPAQQG